MRREQTANLVNTHLSFTVVTALDFNIENSEVSIEEFMEDTADRLLQSLPSPERLSASLARGIIARYTVVLEANFIYWMTGAYLAAKSEDSRSIILDNLREEVRDCHPAMLRRFAVAARALPNDADALAVSRELTNVRLFVAGLSGPKVILMMTFFEGFIQRFMPYLEELAALRGSSEKEYTQVHSECDIEHTQGLLKALYIELALDPPASAADLFEGVELLKTLIECIVDTERHRE